MSVFDMFDPVACELDAMRRKGEAEEAKHDCEGCGERVGVPCLKAYRCEKPKGENYDA
jgi:hypothetical protein